MFLNDNENPENRGGGKTEIMQNEIEWCENVNVKFSANADR